MFPRASLPVPPDTLCSFLNYLSLHQRLEALDEIVGEALHAWLSKAQADGFRQRPATIRGYQWKELFLPDGTRLRSRNDERFLYAAVEGDDIRFEGRALSPNQFNSAVPGVTRSAWRDIYLLFPGEREWKRAIDCRRELAAYARRPAPLPPLQPGAQMQLHKTPMRPARPAPPPPWDGIERRTGYRRQQDLLLD
jgi:hypothetical protein